ncbi:MAG: tetratricopeptide repeat protein [Planctomycetaceae bacterium]
MPRTLLLLLLVLAVAGLTFWFLPRGGAQAEGDLRAAFARARAYFLNETNQDYRRARKELLPFEARLAESAAFHFDLALIDLAELNHEVQGQFDLIPENPRYRSLLDSALRRLERASALAPGDEGVAYNLARTYTKLAAGSEEGDRLWAEAARLLGRLAEVESPDPAALLLLGGCFDVAREFAKAHETYSRIVSLGSDFVPETIFKTAKFLSAQAMMRLPGRQEEATRLLKEYVEKYKESPKGGAAATERGRYTALRDLIEPTAPRPDPRDMRWRRVTPRTGIPASGSPPFAIAPDLDKDCARDLVMMGETGLRVLRNRRNATFEDLTESAGLPADFAVAAAAAGDLDNDGDVDLIAGGPGGVRLFLNARGEEQRKWSFVEATGALGTRAQEPCTCLVLFDLDHDGDLDLFAGGPTNRVWRTVLEHPEPGKTVAGFAEMGEALGMSDFPAAEALMLDVDDDHDADLLVAGPQGAAWFSNLRMLRFERKPLPASGGLAAGDVDNDGVEEVLAGGQAWKWDGVTWRSLCARAALLDLDGDGLLDPEPLAGLTPAARPLRALGSDFNRDGDADLLLVTEAGIDLYLSAPERPYAWLDVMPNGIKTNASGIGTKVSLYAGDLRIGATVRDGLVSFGLGPRALVDAVLYRWTNGVEQGVAPQRMDECLETSEREGEVGSCPFVYVFDGKVWRFVADCHSGTPLGLPYADGKFLPPRSNETILIPGSWLRPSAGQLRVDVTEELRELFFADRILLRAIDRPRESRPILEEAFRMRPVPEFKVHCLADLRPPRAARDGNGSDVLPLVSARDGRHAAVFRALPMQYEGLAHPWSIELDFGDLSGAERVLLVMDGWVEFPTASASIAASQSRTVAFRMPLLEVMGPDGAWVTADADPGFPAGKSKSVLVDLSGKLRGRDGRIRLSSTQRLHWDAFFVSTGPDQPCRVTLLPLLSAWHSYRGQGEMIRDPSGELPPRYEHDRLAASSPWDQLPMGMLTRYGEVAQLLRESDDRYPILASGDLLELAFDAAGLPPLPEGWERDFALSTEGWVKDADMNQAVRESVEPLPFHGMSGYPYGPPEAYPHPDFVREWLTRPGRRLVDTGAMRAGR